MNTRLHFILFFLNNFSTSFRAEDKCFTKLPSVCTSGSVVGSTALPWSRSSLLAQTAVRYLLPDCSVCLLVHSCSLWGLQGCPHSQTTLLLIVLSGQLLLGFVCDWLWFPGFPGQWCWAEAEKHNASVMLLPHVTKHSLSESFLCQLQTVHWPSADWRSFCSSRWEFLIMIRFFSIYQNDHFFSDSVSVVINYTHWF